MIRGALRPLIRGGLRGVITGVSDEFQALIDSLFGAGEQGLFFVPEPGFRGKDVLYQDAAGTTLADANGDPVGLGLEWSKGLELGPELVTNGTFDTNIDGWTNALPDRGSISWSGGRLKLTTAASGTEFRVIASSDAFPTEVGKTYIVEFDAFPSSGVTVRGYAANSLGGTITQNANIQNAGSYQLVFTAPESQAHFNAQISTNSANKEAEFDNISVRELPGNHLTQSTSADRPLYQTDGTLHWLEHDQAGDNLVASLPDLGTNATLAYTNAAGVTILEGQTISGDTIIPQEVELYGVIYLDRPFTASETTKVTNYFNNLRGA